MPSTDQYTRREARIRGSGNRQIKVEQLNIEAPDVDTAANISTPHTHTETTDRELNQKQNLAAHRPRPAANLGPKLEAESDTGPSETSTKPHRLITHAPKSAGLREKRKLAFSSDDEEDFQPTQDAFDRIIEYGTPEMTPDYMPEVPEPVVKQETEEPVNQETEEPVNQETQEAVKQEAAEPVKRKRGRPKKGEVEKKAPVVTRRSRRVVDNPTLQKREPPKPAVPKPFSTMSLLVSQKGKANAAPTARPLASTKKGRQRPMTIETERLHTASTRDRRFNLTTLDVLSHLVDEHTPRPASNDVISENVVLTEFKAHVRFYLDHLSDLHSSVVDISHDLAAVQRKKNDVRRRVLELQKKHSAVGAELSVERRKYYEMKEEHRGFMSMVGAIGDLRNSVQSECVPDTSAEVFSSLADLQRVFHPEHGMRAQMQSVLKALKTLNESRLDP